MMVLEEVTPRNCLKRSRLNVRKFAFSNRIIDDHRPMWNSLSASFATANCATLNNFKCHIYFQKCNWKPETCYARE